MLERILEAYPESEFITIDGFENAIMGVAETADQIHIVYSLSAMFKTLLECEGFDTISDCYEWYSFNMIDLSRKENGPVFFEDVCIE